MDEEHVAGMYLLSNDSQTADRQLYLVLFRSCFLYNFCEGLNGTVANVSNLDAYKDYYGITNELPRSSYPAWSGRISITVGALLGAMLIDWKGKGLLTLRH